MRCPICLEYSDLIRAQVKKTGHEVIICTECDCLWQITGEHIDTGVQTDVTSFLTKSGVQPTWDALSVLGRLPIC